MSSTAIASGQEPPSKKPPAIEPATNPQLPDDLVLECLARVSRLHYPILSLVSKHFRSLTSSPELYRNRYLLNHTEGCPYVCLQFPTEPNLRWFTLCRKPDKTLNSHICKKRKKKTETSSSCNLLVPVQILNSPPVEWSDLVAVDHRLYPINKEEDDDVTCSSSVFFLDCPTHTWVETTSFRFAHTIPELNGKMYLAGSYEVPDSLNCVEVFDVKTQTWKAVPEEKRIFREEDFEGKAYMNVESRSGKRASLVAKLKDSSIFDCVGSGTCLIERRYYCYVSSGKILWSNSDICIKVWRKVEGLPKFGRYSNVKLVECGGKMMVFWDKYVRSRGACKEKMIWCAEISLEIRSSEEVWGKVEWFDAVLTVPKAYKFVYAIAATV